MKILLLTTHLDIGGISVYTMNLARYLRKENVEVSVASGGGALAEVLGKEGIGHFMLDIRTKSEFGFKAWKALPRLARLVKDNGFELVHAQTRVAQVLACLSGRITGVPHVSTCHGFFRYQRLGRKIFPCWGRKVIAISNSVGRHLKEDFHVPGDRVAVIYNGIELQRYAAGPRGKDPALLRILGLAEGGEIVGTVGRLSSVKGQKYLIDAFKGSLARREDLQLLIVGGGPEKENLREQARRMDVADRVFFDDGTRGPLEKYLGLMDIFCLPSLEEGLGLSLMEAMASGCACIASDIGGPSELLEQGRTGILVPAGDSEALAAAITRLAEEKNTRLRFAESARKKAIRDFSIEDNVVRTIDVYRQVVKEPVHEA